MDLTKPLRVMIDAFSHEEAKPDLPFHKNDAISIVSANENGKKFWSVAVLSSRDRYDFTETIADDPRVKKCSQMLFETKELIPLSQVFELIEKEQYQW